MNKKRKGSSARAARDRGSHERSANDSDCVVGGQSFKPPAKPPLWPSETRSAPEMCGYRRLRGRGTVIRTASQTTSVASRDRAAHERSAKPAVSQNVSMALRSPGSVVSRLNERPSPGLVRCNPGRIPRLSRRRRRSSYAAKFWTPKSVAWSRVTTRRITS